VAVRPSQLAVFVEGRTGTPSPQVAYPLPSGVLYAPPNADGSRKGCGNCAFWAENDSLCAIHGDLPITYDQVCGYHVFGEPQVFATAMIRPQGLDPSLTGLELIPGGTSCDLCRFFDGQSACRAVADPETGYPPMRVEPLGCCARWESIDSES
jgi:hypothetical protein